MKKIITLAAGLAVLASSFAVAAPANAAPGSFYRQQAYIVRWCERHPWERECRDFRHHRWGNAEYRRWYWSHRHDRGFDPGAAALFGFGAAVGGAFDHQYRW